MNVHSSNAAFGRMHGEPLTGGIQLDCGNASREAAHRIRNALGVLLLAITVLWAAWRGGGNVAGVCEGKGEPPDGLSKQETVRKVTAANKDSPWENSLGMRFVPVPIKIAPAGSKRVFFSVWDTRVQDYEMFSKETAHEVVKPTFEQGPTHPVVMVSWEDAKAFCAWLTEREHQLGKIGQDERYRLPTDHEWSCAVGIGDQEDAKVPPGDKDGRIKNEYPWGKVWPPPKGAGNYRGGELEVSDPQIPKIQGYDDRFSHTSAVGSFFRNRYGLYDIGGNVWQWCEDLYDSHWNARVVRGGSWNNYERESLLSSFRFNGKPGDRYANYGFRCVLLNQNQTSR